MSSMMQDYAVHMNVGGQLMCWLGVGLMTMQYAYRRDSTSMFVSSILCIVFGLLLIAVGTYNRRVAVR